MSHTGTPTPPEAVDARFRAIADHRRRFLLYYLREHGDATRRELADVLTGWLAAVTGSDADARGRERIHIALQHVHLPKLEAEGFVSYDADTGVVSVEAVPAWVDRCLDEAFRIEVATSEEPPQSLRDLVGG
ncbi:DUF7344 domain-containing protein [Halorientalis halophila]|uniref:DUF7344 domain-containing protein n=1 Tax=Halorientalis halophila TaxID=3108499 RepID=UPI0030086909